MGWALAWWVAMIGPAMLRANVMAIRPVTSWLAAVVLGCQWCWQQSWWCAEMVPTSPRSSSGFDQRPGRLRRMAAAGRS